MHPHTTKPAHDPSHQDMKARIVVAKVSGTCLTCGQGFPPGTSIYWTPRTQETRHVAPCKLPEDEPAAPWPRSDLSDADIAQAMADVQKARSLLGALRGQPYSVIAADGTLGAISKALDLAMNRLEA